MASSRPLRAEVDRRLVVLRTERIDVSPHFGERVHRRLYTTEVYRPRPVRVGLVLTATVEGLNLVVALLWPEDDPPEEEGDTPGGRR